MEYSVLCSMIVKKFALIPERMDSKVSSLQSDGVPRVQSVPPLLAYKFMGAS